MSTNQTWTPLGPTVDVITNTELSALANNTTVTGATPYDNSAGNLYAELTLTITMNIAATAGTGFLVWVHRSYDGTNFESITAVFFAIKPANYSFGAPTNTTQITLTHLIQLSPGKTKYSIQNNGTGQATKTDTTSAGSKLTITPVGLQSA